MAVEATDDEDAEDSGDGADEAGDEGEDADVASDAATFSREDDTDIAALCAGAGFDRGGSGSFGSRVATELTLEELVAIVDSETLSSLDEIAEELTEDSLMVVSWTTMRFSPAGTSDARFASFSPRYVRKSIPMTRPHAVDAIMSE